jgi:protein-S-isoprenylcysteine O-methyltransferase Ste14
MGKALALLYGIVCHLMFLVVFLYLIAFLGNFDVLVPKAIDSGMPGPIGTALLVNILLLAVFGVQHSVMARPGFKRWWTKLVPKPVERSSYVLITNLLLLLLFWQWRPMTGVVWDVQHEVGALVLWILFFLGFGIVVLSSLIIDHFDLFGTRQVFLYARGQPYTPPKFKIAGFYKFVRHPLLAGWVIAFWSTPRMTAGHLLFAIGTTVYMLIAIRLEERDLATFHGDAYREYQQRVSMIVPWPAKK